MRRAGKFGSMCCIRHDSGRCREWHGKARRPNILLITCDQWRGDCLSAAGHPVVKTPNADALAAEGVLFRRHLWRCRTLLAGARLPLHRPLPDEQPRLPQRHAARRAPRQHRACRPPPRLRPDPVRLHRRLARSAPAGARRSAACSSYEGVLPGFTVRQLLPEHQKQWLSWLAARGVDASAGIPGHPPARRWRWPGRRRDQRAAGLFEGRDADGLPRRRVHPLAGRAGAGAPWFAHLSFISPHPPFIVPEPYNTMYDPADGPAFHRAESWEAEAAEPSLSRL